MGVGGTQLLEKSKLKSLLLRNSSILGTFGILNKSEGRGDGGGPKGGGGGFGGKKLLLSPMLKSSFFSLSLFRASIEFPSVSCLELCLKIYSNLFFLPTSVSFIKEPNTGFVHQNVLHL